MKLQDTKGKEEKEMTNEGTIIRLIVDFFPLPSSLPSSFCSSLVVLWLLPSGLMALSAEPVLICSSYPVGTMRLLQIWLPSSKNLIHFLLEAAAFQTL